MFVPTFIEISALIEISRHAK